MKPSQSRSLPQREPGSSASAHPFLILIRSLRVVLAATPEPLNPPNPSTVPQARCSELMYRRPSSEPTQHTKYISRAQRQIFNTVPVAPPIASLLRAVYSNRILSRISFALPTLTHIDVPYQPIRPWRYHQQTSAI